MNKNNDKKNKLLKEDDNKILKWRLAFLIACTVGLCLSIDLLKLHIAVHTDPNYHSYCAISERVNCETVASSKYAVFLGLPLAIWGMIFYIFQGSLCIWGLRKPLRTKTWPFAIVLWLSLLGFIISIYLFFLSHLIIKSLCIICMCTYVINLCMFLFSYIELKQLRKGIIISTRDELKIIKEQFKTFAIFILIFLMLIVILWLFMPKYWTIEAFIGPGGLPIGFTIDGHPWIGAISPQLTIIEFSDYQCPHCFRGHNEIRNIIMKYSSSYRLIHRHYPLDLNCYKELQMQIHPFACLYAKMAYCAGKQNKFWEVNDYLFSNGRRREPISIEELVLHFSLNKAKLENCLNDNETEIAIQNDILEGKKYNIRGTPTYVINNKIYPGYIPPNVLEIK